MFHKIMNEAFFFSWGEPEGDQKGTKSGPKGDWKEPKKGPKVLLPKKKLKRQQEQVAIAGSLFIAYATTNLNPAGFR